MPRLFWSSTATHDSAALATFALLAAATVAIAWRTEAALWALPAAGVFAAAVMIQWAAPEFVEALVLSPGVTRGAIPGPPAGTTLHLAFGAALAVIFGLPAFAAQGRAATALNAQLWSLTGVVVPIVILIALYLRIASLDRSISFAALALALAALYGYATEYLAKRQPQPGLASAAAIYAAGAVASLALALTFALDKGWLTVGLALMVPGIAWISQRRPLPALRYLAAAIIAVVLLRVGYEPRIVGRDVGTTPIFNWLLYGYGVPAASFWYAGYLLRRRADDMPTRLAEAAAILFTVLLMLVQIRHYMNNGDVFRQSAALAEIAMQVSVGFAMAIGLERLRMRTNSVVHNAGALLIFVATLLATLFGLVVGVNPMLTGRPVGGAFFNLVLLGYGIPALLAAILALIARNSRPLAYRAIAATTAVGLALMYLGLEVRTLFHGEILTRGATTDAEQYTYSAVWLVFGVLLLVAGFRLQSQPARLASAAVVALTIGKVFLVDMSDLTGIFRARLLHRPRSGPGWHRLDLSAHAVPCAQGRYNVGITDARSGMNKSTRTYGVVPPEVLKSYDGLSFLKAIIAGELPNPPISELMGFHLAEVEDGRAVFEGLPDFQHYNPIGTVHGGFAATLLDSALGCAIFSTIAKGDAWTTLELKFNLVRPSARTLVLFAQKAASCIVDARSRHRKATSRTARASFMRTLHHDVHDLPDERLKLSCCCRQRARGAEPSGCAVCVRCTLCATVVRPGRVKSQ